MPDRVCTRQTNHDQDPQLWKICRFYAIRNQIQTMEKSKFSFLCLLALCLFLMSAGCTQDQPGATSSLPVPVPAVTQQRADYTSNETLVAFVDSAAAYVTTHGTENALAEFNNPNGSFIRGELYIYAYGFNGTTLAHPVSPEKVGKNRLDEGEIGVFVRQMGEKVRNGSGYYRFTYINPAHNRTLESKMGYGVKIDDDWWLGSGVYTGPADPVTPAP
jgi:cytochrome c